MVGGVVPEPAGSLRSHTPLALSDLQIRKAEQAANPHQMGGGGLELFVQINPDDSQLWRMKDRFLGKEKLLALGAYPAVSLSDARRKKETKPANRSPTALIHRWMRSWTASKRKPGPASVPSAYGIDAAPEPRRRSCARG